MIKVKKEKSILFSFLNHRKTDGRVFYRELRYVLHEMGDDVQIIMLSRIKREQGELISLEEHDVSLDGYSIHCYEFCFSEKCSLIDKVMRNIRFDNLVVKQLRKINPDIYFIADVREIPTAIKAFKNTKTKVVYDSHEDYVRQALDYDGLWLIKYWDAFRFALYERVFIRKFDAVFCTDEFLEKKYLLRKYCAKEVHLLRNYPYYENSNSNFHRDFKECDTLHMVYIGGVDTHRGVIEAAEYIKRFNKEHSNKRITFDIFGNDTEIARSLADGDAIICHSWIDHKDLMQLLRTEYDVGVCLWQPLPKFYRNLPIKNFDYMGAGLPIITSNFGNLKIHADRSRSGYCIDPTSYKEFENASLEMFDPEKRMKFFRNGLNYVREEAAFQTEAKPLIKYFKDALDI